MEIILLVLAIVGFCGLITTNWGAEAIVTAFVFFWRMFYWSVGILIFLAVAAAIVEGQVT